eukprot:2433887-Alexandrium_andersonii.AAC.1
MGRGEGVHRACRTGLGAPHGAASAVVAAAARTAGCGRPVHARELARDCRAAPDGHQNDPRGDGK